MVYVLYNAKSNNGKGAEELEKLRDFRKEEAIEYLNIIEISDYREFFDRLADTDEVIIAGGDGTLNRFINNTEGIDIRNPVYSYAAGTGNDFLKDVEDKAENGIIRINEYIKDLPVVTVNGKSSKFLNGVGYGIDGYCCEVGDELALKSDKPINYASIAIKGLLFHFHPTNATITVDGKTKKYQKVWLAPTMNGRYYGGGMKIAPDQDRLNSERCVTCVVFHNAGKIRTLTAFPKIFTGEHVKYTKILDFICGHEVKVEFDRPTALQIDGETVRNVTEYTVKSGIGLALKTEDEVSEALRVN